MDEDSDVTVTLPLRQWRAIAVHVEGGVYREVQPILAAIYEQVNAQIAAANEHAAAVAVAAEIQAAEAERDASHPENGVDDPSESHSNIQRTGLH